MAGSCGTRPACAVMARVPDATKADFQLLLDVRHFEIATRPQMRAEVEIAAKLLRPDGTVVDLKVFKASEPLAAVEASAAAKAIGTAFQRVAAGVVEDGDEPMVIDELDHFAIPLREVQRMIDEAFRRAGSWNRGRGASRW